jgi:hypothetical protein
MHSQNSPGVPPVDKQCTFCLEGIPQLNNQGPYRLLLAIGDAVEGGFVLHEHSAVSFRVTTGHFSHQEVELFPCRNVWDLPFLSQLLQLLDPFIEPLIHGLLGIIPALIPLLI